jgi:hypothetical protein
MSRREPQAAGSGAPLRRAVILAAILSVVATAVAIGALAVVLTRGTDTGPTGQADPNACRTVAWNALPSVSALPPGWAIASSRFLVGILTTTLVGPVPSGSTQGPAAFVSVSCYGTDAALVIARDHEAALGDGAGATDVSFPKLGDESLAVTSTRTSSTTVYIRRGVLVADITAATSLDQAALQAVAGAVDGAMLRSLSASPRPSTTPAAAGSGIPSPAASPGPSASTASPSQSAAAVSHVAPDLEALLPHSVDGTALSSQSVVGTTALGNDTTSQSLIASLEKLGKTSADLEIAEAHDPTGTLALRLFGFRAKGVKASDLAAAIVESWMASALSAPKRSDVTIAGQKQSRVAYSQGPVDYVFERNGVVFDIETTDESLVSKVLPLLE